MSGEQTADMTSIEEVQRQLDDLQAMYASLQERHAEAEKQLQTSAEAGQYLLDQNEELHNEVRASTKHVGDLELEVQGLLKMSSAGNAPPTPVVHEIGSSGVVLSPQASTSAGCSAAQKSYRKRDDSWLSESMSHRKRSDSVLSDETNPRVGRDLRSSSHGESSRRRSYPEGLDKQTLELMSRFQVMEDEMHQLELENRCLQRSQQGLQEELRQSKDELRQNNAKHENSRYSAKLKDLRDEKLRYSLTLKDARWPSHDVQDLKKHNFAFSRAKSDGAYEGQAHARDDDDEEADSHVLLIKKTEKLSAEQAKVKALESRIEQLQQELDTLKHKDFQEQDEHKRKLETLSEDHAKLILKTRELEEENKRLLTEYLDQQRYLEQSQLREKDLQQLLNERDRNKEIEVVSMDLAETLLTADSVDEVGSAADETVSTPVSRRSNRRMSGVLRMSKSISLMDELDCEDTSPENEADDSHDEKVLHKELSEARAEAQHLRRKLSTITDLHRRSQEGLSKLFNELGEQEATGTVAEVYKECADEARTELERLRRELRDERLTSKTLRSQMEELRLASPNDDRALVQTSLADDGERQNSFSAYDLEQWTRPEISISSAPVDVAVASAPEPTKPTFWEQLVAASSFTFAMSTCRRSPKQPMYTRNQEDVLRSLQASLDFLEGRDLMKVCDQESGPSDDAVRGVRPPHVAAPGTGGIGDSPISVSNSDDAESRQSGHLRAHP